MYRILPDADSFAARKEAEMEGKPQRFLRLADVLVRIPYSRSTIYQLVAQGKFPKPISLGDRAVAWVEADIDKWMGDRIAAVGRG